MAAVLAVLFVVPVWVLFVGRRPLDPSRVFFAYWLIIVLFSYLLYPSSFISVDAVLYVLIASIVFSGGVLIGRLDRPDKAGPPIRLSLPTLRVLRLVAIAASVAGMTAALTAFIQSGSMAPPRDLASLAEFTNSISEQRYSRGDYAVSAAIPLSLLVVYSASMITPLIPLRSDTRADRFLVWLPALSSVPYAVVTSARLGMLTAFALTVGGVIGRRWVAKEDLPELNLRVILKGLVVVAVVSVLFVGIGVLRIGVVTGESVRLSIAKQPAYTLAPLAAFSSWLSERENDPLSSTPQLGAASVAGMSLLVDRDRDATRAYDQSVVVDGSGTTTNIYTLFRGLILDFGPLGTLVAMAILGVCLGWSTLRAARGSVAATLVMAFMYAIIFMSNWLAITTFSNVLMALPLAMLVVLLSREPIQRAIPAQDGVSFPRP